jgi:diphosphomevalonate decarboxylase
LKDQNGMQGTAIAQPNIALIKYWGKRDIERNLPAVGSISITLRDLYTRMHVELDGALAADVLTVNDDPDEKMLPRLSSCLDRVAGTGRSCARIASTCNFPIAAGLASSASSFAALTVAAAGAAGQSFDVARLASLAGQASGSAARSLLGGFVELENVGDDIACRSLGGAGDWPLTVVVAITESGPKAVGSTEAMEISRRTSPFYSNWIDQQAEDLDTARAAIAARDFEMLAAIAEHNCLKMHSIMWASRPPMVYWNSATMRCLQTVRQLQGQGTEVFFTIDAGPQVKAVCLPEHAAAVEAALRTTVGVVDILTTGLGEGARLESQG